MPDSPLLQRLKERKLVQWVLAYLAGAFVVVQLLDGLEGALGLTPTIQRGILVLVAIGFFITFILAWYHGEKGRQRVSGPELLMVAALLVVGGVALTLLHPHGENSSAVALKDDDRPGIAVFPCENRSPDPEDAYFASGIHDEILLRLSKVSGLRSIGRESMEWYNEHPLPPRQVAQELGVSYLGECSVLKDAERNQVRLTFLLMEGSTGTQVWAEDYDEDLTARSIFDIYTDLAGQVARQVGAVITPAEQERIAERPTENSEAYDLYLRGRILWRTRGLGALEEAIELFQAAITQDPDFALAHAGLAETYAILPERGGPPYSEVLPFARRAAETALSLDPSLAEAHNASGYISAVFEWNWAAAEKDYRRAIELNPDYGTAHQWYGEMLAQLGRWEEALVEITKGVELDPRSAASNTMMGYLLSIPGHYSEAIRWFEQAHMIAPAFPPPCWGLGDVYTAMGDLEKAGTWYERAAGLAGDDPEIAPVFLTALSDPGKVPDAVSVLQASEDNYRAAQYLALLGETDEAVAALERAFVEHAPYLPWINCLPYFDGIRSDPRFQALLRRMNLVE
jgi:TolB-like protein/Tfp pilus assembly protein PilF